MPDLIHLLPSRPDYFDREPLVVVNNYVGLSQGPHGLTLRTLYSVPSRRKAYVEAAVTHVLRVNPAGAAGVPESWVYILPAVGGSVRFSIARILANNVGERDSMVTSGIGMVGAGDAVSGQTQDNSTGGFVDYIIGVKATEFDAL